MENDLISRRALFNALFVHNGISVALEIAKSVGVLEASVNVVRRG